MERAASNTTRTNPIPSNWSAEEVLEWAERMRLPLSIIEALRENQVDGPTLVTLRKDEIRTELGITSLPARRYLWDSIETVKKQQDTMDHASALLLLQSEIRHLENNNHVHHDDPKSPNNVDSAVLSLLKQDVDLRVQSASDHLCALRLHSTGNFANLQSYEDSHTAQQEQVRLDRLSIVSAYDHSVALQFQQQQQQQQGRRSATVVATAAQSTLFQLCIQACIRYHINVGQAFASGTARPIPRYRGTNSSSTAQQQQHQGRETIPAIPSRTAGSWNPQAKNEDGGTNTGLKHPIAASNTARYNRLAAPRYSSTAKQDRRGKSSSSSLKDLPRIDQCDVCYAEEEPGFTLACNHSQCVDCMTRHLRVALHDRSLLPLKCCEVPIDMETLSKMLLRPAEVALLTTRTQEVSATNKMYCPNCSRFINLDLVDRDTGASSNLLCECRQLLCVECKTAAHPAMACAENKQAATATDEALIRLASNEGWKQCPRCSIMIELSIGCYHMSCTNCTHEFCFRCLSDWDSSNGTCSTGNCPSWDERRLIQQAEARVDAQLAAEARRPARAADRRAGPAVANPFDFNRILRNAAAVDPFEREQRVQHEMRALRGNEGCFHQWTRTSMSGRECERCGFYLWVYGMVCHGGCGTTVCYTCAHHRIPRWGWR
ncbi:hypothetical protein ACA910_021727 [Epithemia clementina (nom. ined.)]